MTHDEAERIAEATLLIWSGQNYGDYLDAYEEADWWSLSRMPPTPISQAEWVAAESFEEYLVTTVAQFILKNT
jgi:hypothetical protein